MCRCVFDLPAKERELATLREQAQSPDLWSDQAHAQRVMKGVSRLESLLAIWQDLEGNSRDLQALLELAEEASDEEHDALAGDIERELSVLERQYAALELQLTMGGPYDGRNAMVSIHAG